MVTAPSAIALQEGGKSAVNTHYMHIFSLKSVSRLPQFGVHLIETDDYDAGEEPAVNTEVRSLEHRNGA
jgi:hypothetical protein